MIKLTRNFSPLCLAPAEVKRLTAEFKASGASVWNFTALKEALLTTSYGKCAYCECDLTEESKYMEVEHFRDKGSNPNDVVAWENLLPSCKKCNGAKSIHDVVADPIVNPYEDDPRDHFEFRLYRFRPKSVIGDMSIGVVALNDQNRVVVVRFEIGEKIHESLQSASEALDHYKVNGATRTKNRLIGIVKGILLECQPSSEYAATASSVLHSDKLYAKITAEMNKIGLWSAELASLHGCSLEIALDVV